MGFLKGLFFVFLAVVLLSVIIGSPFTSGVAWFFKTIGNFFTTITKLLKHAGH